MPAGEGGVPASGVRTDPDHVGSGLGEDLEAVAERARLAVHPGAAEALASEPASGQDDHHDGSTGQV